MPWSGPGRNRTEQQNNRRPFKGASTKQRLWVDDNVVYGNRCPRAHLFTGVVADVARRGGRGGGRIGLSPPPLCVDPGSCDARMRYDPVGRRSAGAAWARDQILGPVAPSGLGSRPVVKPLDSLREAQGGAQGGDL